MGKSEQTRQYIIEKTAPVMNKKGIAGTAISDVMEATKLAKGGIYGNFESKDEICAETLNYLTAKIARGLDSAAAEKESARDKLYALLEYYMDHIAMDEKMGGCPLLNFGTEADDTNSEVRKLVARSVKRSQARFEKIIQSGKDNGEFSKRTDAKAMAMKIFIMIEGAIFTSRVTDNKVVMETAVDLIKKDISAF